MVEVLIFGWQKLSSKCDLRERIDRGCKSEVMYTPLDLCFLTRIVALWRSGENISFSSGTILHVRLGGLFRISLFFGCVIEFIR